MRMILKTTLSIGNKKIEEENTKVLFCCTNSRSKPRRGPQFYTRRHANIHSHNHVVTVPIQSSQYRNKSSSFVEPLVKLESPVDAFHSTAACPLACDVKVFCSVWSCDPLAEHGTTRGAPAACVSRATRAIAGAVPVFAVRPDSP